MDGIDKRMKGPIWYSWITKMGHQRAITYRTPDGEEGQTLWYDDVKDAAKQFEQIKEAWEKNQKLPR
jgi:hypothetical protein